jgi:hypothetical protein
MINGISVQPSTTALQPSSRICPMTRELLRIVRELIDDAS